MLFKRGDDVLVRPGKRVGGRGDCGRRRVGVQLRASAGGHRGNFGFNELVKHMLVAGRVVHQVPRCIADHLGHVVRGQSRMSEGRRRCSKCKAHDLMAREKRTQYKYGKHAHDMHPNRIIPYASSADTSASDDWREKVASAVEGKLNPKQRQLADRLLEKEKPKNAKLYKGLFFASFVAAIVGAVMMIVHEKKTRGTGHENLLVPILMACVQVFKLPEFFQQMQGDDTSTHQLLFWGTFINLGLWSASIYYAR